ncbi:bifunctional adenosylcobinamide kinase/adenosylcobinamide-phosphate guanylyltransferase [Fusobacterium sp. MFO224]|uniref:bifunctional adenosylcobinamide kinase/adenosylcobinamide-phosphate guanylyltransferase n=1 Tax=Fusobacterium sp. MFO224 TaxID=3378070 RepID=UPI003852E524
MGKVIYVSGGACSGKSFFSEKYIEKKYSKKIYLATGIPFDQEMKDRIEKHIKQRGNNWKTIENYKNLKDILKEFAEEYDIILLDCLTNLITNYMIMDNDIIWDKATPKNVDDIKETITKEITSLIDFIKENNIDILIVSNEVGMGSIPDYPLGRFFRDINGKLNQLIAAKSEEAYFIVSGLPIKLK